jgi:hypothetical protein
MVLSKRERYIAIITIAVVAILILDRYVVTPFMDAGERTGLEKQSLMADMAQAENLFKRRSLMDQRWEDMRAGGLDSDASKVESQVLHAIRNWSNENRLTLSSVKPYREEGEEVLRQIMFQVAGTGTMESVCRFLWHIENASLPIRIAEVQMGSRKEDGNDMSIQMRLSALYVGEADDQEQ